MPFLVRVLHGLANRHEQFQPLPRRQLARGRRIGVSVGPRTEFHHEERLAGRRQAGVVDLRDVRVVHQRQRLPLLLEAREH
jgi:hypothetical protein